MSTYRYEVFDNSRYALQVRSTSDGKNGISLEADDYRVGMILPTGPKLTEFLQAVADDTHVVIPVADLPEVEVEYDSLNKRTRVSVDGLSFVVDHRPFIEQALRNNVAILRAMDAHEAEQVDEGETKVAELKNRLRRTFKDVAGPLLHPAHDDSPEAWDAIAREAIAWHEEQGR